MDDPFENPRDMIRRVCAEAEALNASADAWLAQHRQRQDLKRKNYPDLVYKVHEEPPPKQQSAVMDEATQRKWDAWCEAHINNALAKYTEKLIEAVAEALVHDRQKMREHVAEKIGQLLADMTVQTAIAKGEIAAIKKGSRDAA